VKTKLTKDILALGVKVAGKLRSKYITQHVFVIVEVANV
jgi:hypothetical protein